MSTAVLFATAPAGDGGPAAALAWEQTTLLGRLLEQIAELGVREAHLVTRPEWAPELERRAEGHGVARAAAAVAPTPPRTCAPPPRSRATATARSWSPTRTSSPRARRSRACSPIRASPPACSRRPCGASSATWASARARGAAAWSAPARRTTTIHQPNGTFLGVLKVAPRPARGARRRRRAARRARRRPAARGLARGARGEGRPLEARAPPPRARAAPSRADDDEPADADAACRRTRPSSAPDDVELSAEDDAELRRRLAAAEQDVPSLLLCGLVRSEVQVGGSHLRRLFWTRPLTPEDVAQARRARSASTTRTGRCSTPR